ncbi:MAG: glutamate--tRNA ligase [Haliscomenobacteraceae bacterium CHB4]|nr:Glutamate--tRNA ligase [Saprospiraceae bacterium]MCE7923851.1 glutamate--tRNA ligase [Haliscomenobacteraceae bacterium CHB4]
MTKPRVRFAPSPTGALHIGGVRTALYNYLFAKQQGGAFILRIEDTDQNRYVPGAEKYIIETLRWVGLIPDEGVDFDGAYGPYRQSDRKEIYQKYARELVTRGRAYYAFDTPEALEVRRAAEENFTYNHLTRGGLTNSLTLPAAEVQHRLDAGEPCVIRLLVEPGQAIRINDLIRGEVVFQSSELDDKVLLKADGMPTYHLANIVDDHLMAITHVIRGEEWLPSTAHHVLLYEGFGWQDTMPQFAHLPLILKPVGNGKLSKRDGAKFGIPVFPLEWKGATPEDSFSGFRDTGFLPEAVINFLALLGWHPGGEQEIFSLNELIAAFSIEHISKGGARFDYEKARWFNQKYIQAADNGVLATHIRPLAEAKGYRVSDAYLAQVAGLMKERVTFLPDFVEVGYYLFESVRVYDAEALHKKWNTGLSPVFEDLTDLVATFEPFNGVALEEAVKNFISAKGLKPGDVLPLLRLALAGTMKGPAIFDMAEALGQDETAERLRRFVAYAGKNAESAVNG